MSEQDAALAEEARAILAAGGCEAIRVDGAGDEWHVWCGYRPGEFFVTAFSAKNPETPNDPVYLAQQALATLQRNEGPKPEPESLFGEPAEAAYGGEDETHGETGEAEDDFGSGGGVHPDDAGEPDFTAGAGAAADTASVLESFDADFAPIEDEPSERDALDADLFPIRGIAWSEEAEPEAEPDTTGPIAYAASDLDALVREKLGRVSQIARELKAALQDGWTIDEFRSLQNLIVRIDRGEATDDAQARARFVAISERSQAMSRVDAHRDALEAALDAIGKARDYQGAKDFNPEVGWPG